jgi:hypothetical protein
MNYDLAKELKDAGFLQRGDGSYVFPEIDTGETNKTLRRYAPTLSELIEACGDEFDRLERDTDGTKEYPKVYFCAYAVSRDSGQFGSTPEEALTRLWLALNKTV